MFLGTHFLFFLHSTFLGFHTSKTFSSSAEQVRNGRSRRALLVLHVWMLKMTHSFFYHTRSPLSDSAVEQRLISGTL
ncbi:hypothetical protein B0J13DRAFT_536916 [Dactylonectria estremocensis]|uniref:Secreted protein n=1 Tax=Dactylonectria estremocensis TaxID=1079267 RepID=A0A9P9FIA3_9HYPO|nr:hypothetical protein B0J13DRAFT_536916 [Dactylonectria estremocensis]